MRLLRTLPSHERQAQELGHLSSPDARQPSYVIRLAHSITLYRYYYAARRLQFPLSARGICALPLKSITFEYSGQPEIAPSSVTYTCDKPSIGGIQDIRDRKSVNVQGESDSDLKVLTPWLSLRKEAQISSQNTSSSTVKYMEVAPLVNLDPAREFNDCPRYHQPRSRILTALFKEIVKDIDLILLQYGPGQCHRSEEARSKFLAPVCPHFLLGS